MPNNNCNKGGRAVTKFVMLSMSFVVSKEYPASFKWVSDQSIFCGAEYHLLILKANEKELLKVDNVDAGSEKLLQLNSEIVELVENI